MDFHGDGAYAPRGLVKITQKTIKEKAIKRLKTTYLLINLK